jgi:hypothetical protein
MVGKPAVHLPFAFGAWFMPTSTVAVMWQWKWIFNPIVFLTQLANSSFVPRMGPCIAPIPVHAQAAHAMAD